ncbi:MAG: hypothetical protein PHC43_02660 [Candidatus Marinimicrobia bacterium]|jgi:hypothetical protein|nr:hypothetical protein [Candidatus Omnitrophota bacterium]MDD5230204.1 hypothetical protein [Candidatus Neomarinimicrobiota bacterium]
MISKINKSRNLPQLTLLGERIGWALLKEKIMWFKKKTKKEPRVFILPEKSERRIRTLLAEFKNCRTALNHYNLWSEIAEIFPEVKEGEWTIKTNNAFQTRIVEDIE